MKLNRQSADKISANSAFPTKISPILNLSLFQISKINPSIFRHLLPHPLTVAYNGGSAEDIVRGEVSVRMLAVKSISVRKSRSGEVTNKVINRKCYIIGKQPNADWSDGRGLSGRSDHPPTLQTRKLPSKSISRYEANSVSNINPFSYSRLPLAWTYSKLPVLRNTSSSSPCATTLSKATTRRRLSPAHSPCQATESNLILSALSSRASIPTLAWLTEPITKSGFAARSLWSKKTTSSSSLAIR